MKVCLPNCLPFQMFILISFLINASSSQFGCAMCVYGTCQSETTTSADNHCRCLRGYWGRYCALVDTTLIEPLTSVDAALFYFKEPVLATQFSVEVTPNTSDSNIIMAYRKQTNGIGIASLLPETTYKVCFETILNRTQKLVTLQDKNYIKESMPCIEITTNRDTDGVYLLIAIICGGFVGGLTFILIAYELCKLCIIKRELRFLNIAQTNDKLLEGTIFKILETRMSLKEARQKIIFRRVFRVKRKKHIEDDDIKTRPVVVWFRRRKDRQKVLDAAVKSTKLMVDGSKILLPPGAGF